MFNNYLKIDYKNRDNNIYQFIIKMQMTASSALSTVSALIRDGDLFTNFFEALSPSHQHMISQISQHPLVKATTGTNYVGTLTGT